MLTWLTLLLLTGCDSRIGSNAGPRIAFERPMDGDVIAGETDAVVTIADGARPVSLTVYAGDVELGRVTGPGARVTVPIDTTSLADGIVELTASVRFDDGRRSEDGQAGT